MKLLVIEDEENKAKHILSLLYNIIDKNEIHLAKSYMSTLMQLKKYVYDVIILDMSLPLRDIKYDQDDFNTFAGLEILDELKRKNRKERVIVFTAFDMLGENDKKISLSELNEKMHQKYSSNYIGCVHYNALSLEWKEEVLNKLKRCEEL